MSRFLNPQNSMFIAFSGDVATLHRLLTKFYEELKGSLEVWKVAYAEKNEKQIFEIQHRWLSGLRTLNYEETSKIIAQEQVLLHSGQWPSEATKQIASEIKKVLADLEKEIPLMGLH